MAQSFDAELIRKNILQKRNTLSPHDIQSTSSQLVSKWLKRAECLLPELKWAALYRATQGETILDELAWSFEQRKLLTFFPKVLDAEGTDLQFFSARLSHSNNWETGHFGILEPRLGSPLPLDQKAGVFFVPGLAFSKKGERLGYGKGFYDRFLADHPQSLRVALIYDFQWFDQLPQHEGDEQLDWILSPTNEYRSTRLEKRLESLLRGTPK